MSNRKKKTVSPNWLIFGTSVALPVCMKLAKLFQLFFKKNFVAPFYGWGSTASRLVPVQGGSLLFTSKFPHIPGTHFTELRSMKG